MAVIGLDEFARYFTGYEECYTIIGIAACEIQAIFLSSKRLDTQNPHTNAGILSIKYFEINLQLSSEPPCS